MSLLDFDATPDAYGVMGNPIAHSKSPLIHRLFAEQTGQRLTYEPILVERGGFRQAVDNHRAHGFKGLNITVPFKQEAWALADRRTARAESAGAVNTLKFEPDGVLGDNTDGVGLVADLTTNRGWTLSGKRILVLGAGGAVRGVLGPLLEAGPAELVVANRTVERADDLARLFGQPVAGCGFEALPGRRFDGVINGTSASLQGELPPLPGDLLAEGAFCYDMMYGREPTPFMVWAREHGAAAVADGLGMLVEQAAESFRLWRGVRPETGPVIAAVREQLSAG